MKFSPVVALGVAALVLPHARAHAEDAWQKTLQEDGIVVSTRTQPGRELPSFRGQGTVAAPVLQVLAVVLDDARTKEWAKDADEAEVLRTVNAHQQFVYSRSHQTWPVQDRDLVMRRTVDVLTPGTAFRVRLVCVDGEKPPVPSVIRIRDCETEFVLRALDDGHTAVDYRVRADPGGHNPAWAVRWASRNIPLETLQQLRKQVDKTRGDYAAVMESWSSAR